jgi:hypothetical protein
LLVSTAMPSVCGMPQHTITQKNPSGAQGPHTAQAGKNVRGTLGLVLLCLQKRRKTGAGCTGCMKTYSYSYCRYSFQRP